MIRRRLLGLLAAAVAAVATVPLAAAPPEQVSEAALRRHIQILAADAMEGRRPGTPGGERAVAYIFDQMKALGLRPGAADGGWLQPVALVERRARAGTLTRGALTLGEGDIVLLPRDAQARLSDAPLIFIGHGDGTGAAVRGAIVVLLGGAAPKGQTPRPVADRIARLADQGAAAVLVPIAGSAPWSAVVAQYDGRMSAAAAVLPPVQGALSASGWIRLLRAAGADPAAVARDAARPGFRPLRLGSAGLAAEAGIRRFTAPNVIGVLPGEGAPKEAVALLAHWDHLGLCRPAKAADRICNGAVDNASGVAELLEVARLLVAGPRPARSILFVATTAEEYGLLGARAFAASPPLPLRAGLNLDTVAIAPRGAPIATIGRGLTPLDPLIDATAAALGRKVVTGAERNVLVARQDGWALLQAGVPAVMVGSASADLARLNRFLAGAYHGPKDEIAGIELGGAADDGAFLAALTRRLADPRQFAGGKR